MIRRPTFPTLSERPARKRVPRDAEETQVVRNALRLIRMHRHSRDATGNGGCSCRQPYWLLRPAVYCSKEWPTTSRWRWSCPYQHWTRGLVVEGWWWGGWGGARAGAWEAMGLIVCGVGWARSRVPKGRRAGPDPDLFLYWNQPDAQIDCRTYQCSSLKPHSN